MKLTIFFKSGVTTQLVNLATPEKTMGEIQEAMATGRTLAVWPDFILRPDQVDCVHLSEGVPAVSLPKRRN